MIAVNNLVKWYGPNLAVDHLTFEIPRGQIVGFLGPNGAGKSTTLRMLTGYLPPTSGTATIDGQDILTASHEARRRIGYLPESTPLYPEMRVEEYLHYRGQLMGMSRGDRKKRIDVVCDRCSLTPVRRRLIGHLSKGNRQRVGLAQALLHNPPVLILDEPTAGLDPNQINAVRGLIHELKDQHTVLLSTHILPEVEKSADRVLIIARGRIVAQGTPQELLQQVTAGAKVVVEVNAPQADVKSRLEALPAVSQVHTQEAEGWTLATVTPAEGGDIRQLLGQAVLDNRWVLREMRYETATLEQYFIQITAQQYQAPAEAAASA
jgi:ABC-2 type transport system ATP-binding protein